MMVFSVKTKSSAVSISILPALGRREAVPILASGLPVEKEKDPAEAEAGGRVRARARMKTKGAMAAPARSRKF
jgi:hypothetical protein